MGIARMRQQCILVPGRFFPPRKKWPGNEAKAAYSANQSDLRTSVTSFISTYIVCQRGPYASLRDCLELASYIDREAATSLDWKQKAEAIFKFVKQKGQRSRMSELAVKLLRNHTFHGNNSLDVWHIMAGLPLPRRLRCLSMYRTSCQMRMREVYVESNLKFKGQTSGL